MGPRYLRQRADEVIVREFITLLGGTAAAWPIHFAPRRPDCLAGVVGLEPANPSARYLIGIA
jgi:hypothetical protein